MGLRVFCLASGVGGSEDHWGAETRGDSLQEASTVLPASVTVPAQGLSLQPPLRSAHVPGKKSDTPRASRRGRGLSSGTKVGGWRAAGSPRKLGLPRAGPECQAKGLKPSPVGNREPLKVSE